MDFSKKTRIKIQKEVLATDIPAVVMGKICKNGEMYFYGYGPSRWGINDKISEKNIFVIASMTKSITSVAALQLVERGEVSLDEPLDAYLPEMASIPILNKKDEIVKPRSSICLRHLLTHTAGFGYSFTCPQLGIWNDLKLKLKWTKKYEPRFFESGTSFMYGSSTDWVGKLVEKISGMNLEEYFRQNICGPLGMNSTWFNIPTELQPLYVSSSHRNSINGNIVLDKYEKRSRINNYKGGAGLSSSPEDYGKFLACMLNKGNFNGTEILTEKTFDILNSCQLSTFKQIHRYVPANNVETKPRGGKDYFFNSYDNWTLAWAYTENSILRPRGTAYWGGFRNTYFTIDFVNEFGLIYMTQIKPFNDLGSYNLFKSFERIVYSSINN